MKGEWRKAGVGRKSLRLQCSSRKVLVTLEDLGNFQTKMASHRNSVSSRNGLGIVPSFSSGIGQGHSVGAEASV